MDKIEQQSRIERLINLWAIEALKYQGEEREAALRRIWQENFDTAKEASAADPEAREIADKMDEFTRALVRLIENSGGGQGGTA